MPNGISTRRQLRRLGRLAISADQQAALPDMWTRRVSGARPQSIAGSSPNASGSAPVMASTFLPLFNVTGFLTSDVPIALSATPC
jgi:hypothetical protein